MKKRIQLRTALRFGLLLLLAVLILPETASAMQTVQETPVPEAAATMSPIQLRDRFQRTRNGLRLRNATVVPSIPMPTQTPYYIVVTATPGTVPTYGIEPDVLVQKKAYDCAVNVNKPYFYQQFAPGDDFDFDVTFTNTGTQPWTTDIDVQQYTGWRMEIEHRYTYDIDKDYDSARIVYPGQSIRWKIRMEAPKDQSSENGKYFSTYYLVHGVFNNNVEETYSRLFCPFSVYIYVPHK